VNPLVPATVLIGCLALALRGLALVRDPGVLARFGAAETAEGKPTGTSPIERLYDRLGAVLGPLVMRATGERRLARLCARLDAAGRPNGMTVERFCARQGTVALFVGLAGLMLVVRGAFFVGLPLMLVGWLFMELWLDRAARKRQASIERDLPDFLDIVAVCVGAGIAFRPALTRVGEAVGGPLGEEIATALRQMALGANRREAFERLRDRNPCESLGQFTSALLQAEELGVPLIGALVDMAADMRRDAYQRARRRAQRAAPRVSLIITTLIVPGAMLLIIAGLLLGSRVQPGQIFGG